MAAAKNRPESSSNAMLKCMKIVREPFLIAKNDVEPPGTVQLCMPIQCPGDSVILATPLLYTECTKAIIRHFLKKKLEVPGK